jgi:hypothetical protein
MAQTHVQSHGETHGDMASHTNTYQGFIKGSIITALLSFYSLVGLANIGFGKSWPVFWCFAGIIAGTIAVLIDLKAGAKWYLSGGLLVLYALFTAYNVI